MRDFAVRGAKHSKDLPPGVVSEAQPPTRSQGIFAFLAGAVTACLLTLASLATAQEWTFVDVTEKAGFDYTHGYVGGPTEGPRIMSAGVAAGDYDNDGWVDLFIARGNSGGRGNLLYRNMGDGTFMDVAEAVGLDMPGMMLIAPAFADVDGDGRLDLLVGGIEGTRLSLFRNRPDGTFEDVTSLTGFFSTSDTYSAAFGDYDLDGDLDMCQSHWGSPAGLTHVWRNEGGMSFVSVDRHAQVTGLYFDMVWDYTFTPNFADIDNDGWPDLLMVSDFNMSQVFLNDQDGTFTNITDADVVTDENGMGTAIGDYDNDGDLDWFVSSIWDPPLPPAITVEDPGDTIIAGWGVTGNRFYRNLGDGTFEDVTDLTGTRQGDWGWGSAFVDLNNDGHLDLFHVNGFVTGQFILDRARLFVSNGDGTFTERGIELGLADTGQGRGVACFDYDHDGDIDIFIANNHQPPKLYRNDGGNSLGSYFDVRLEGDSPNTEAIGGRVYVTVGDVTQMRELRAGSNFSSQDPALAHFGLGTATRVDELRIVWPDGSENMLRDVPANREATYNQAELRQAPPVQSRALRTWPVPSRDVVRFGWPAAGTSAVLQIFDITGARVWKANVPAGMKTTQWDGRDAGGRVMRPGVYHARLRHPGGVFTAKFVLAP